MSSLIFKYPLNIFKYVNVIKKTIIKSLGMQGAYLYTATIYNII